MASTRGIVSKPDCPDKLALAIGRFVVHFSYLEFSLWFWFNEIHDDRDAMREFVTKEFTEKLRRIRRPIDESTMPVDDRKMFMSLFDRAAALAITRNLVCHNPYLTLGSGENEVHRGAIFGIRKTSLEDVPEIATIPKAGIPEIERFASDAAVLCEDFYRGLVVLQRHLPLTKK